ncbi:hypothetical protein [Hellea balneolensis]|uniref:hypothetical protein n=1 Tax=Hellea balneolensis TaxID=287478 RepID=UPI0004087278|nr:hypothetical protein [Hellea balneolensis]
MSFSESAHEPIVTSDVSAKEQMDGLSLVTTQERVSLNNDVTAQFSDIPQTSVEYLAVNCKSPEHLPIALSILSKALKENPSLLEDEFEAEFELDDCLNQAEITAKSDRRTANAETIEQKESEGEQLDTVIKGLRHEIELASQGKTGRDQLAFAQSLLKEKLSETDLSADVKAEQISWLEGVSLSLDRMEGLVEDPKEAKVFQSLVATIDLNFNGGDNATTFADLLIKVDASDNLSEATKTKLHVQGLGVIRNSTDLIAASEMARETGQFVNPKTNRVEHFTEKNGMPLGDYTVYPDLKHPKEFVAKAEVGGRTLSVPYSLDDDPAFLNRLIKAAMVGGVLAERDFQGATREIFGKSDLAAQGYSEIRLDAEQAARAEQLYGAFMGVGTVLSSEFPSESDLQSFKWRLQATHIDGDAKTNDNTGRGDLSWGKLGLLQNGHLNMTRVGEVGAYLNTKSTALPTFENLESKFGDNNFA